MGRSFVVTLALAVSVVPALVLPSAPDRTAPRPGPVVVDRLPDLRPVESDLADYDLRRTRDGRVLLRFIGEIANAGLGGLHVVGRRERPPSQGPWGNVLTAYQRINRSDGSSRMVRIGTMVWHAAHHHFHLTRVVHYRLLDSSGRVVRDVPKVTFCLRDNEPVLPDLPGFRGRERYGNCANTARAQRIVMGISIGWMDIYGKDTPGQTMDVTDLVWRPRQEYTLEMTVNPDGVIREVNRAHPRSVSVQLPLGR